MKERPIIFSTAMVQAILEGRKTMTRRIINTDRLGWDCHSMKFLRICTYDDPRVGLQAFFKDNSELSILGVKCPYGEPGDLLWVKETFENDMGQINYKASNPEVIYNPYYEMLTKWKPSIFMPRVASRITLKIIRIKVERLHDITQEDAKKEGATLASSIDYVSAFAGIWGGIHGYHGWVSNPWVWVIEFERIT